MSERPYAPTHPDSGFGERQQDVGVPGAIEPKRFVQREVTRTNIQARRVHAEQFPRQVAELGSTFGNPHDHGRTTRATVRAGISKKKTLALETQAERRCDHRLANDRHMMQRVVKSKREPDDQQRTQ